MDRERGTVHIIEPQELFVPTLIDVFSEAGIFVDRVDEHVDPHVLLEEQPYLLFIDTDYVDDPLRMIRLARMLVASVRIVAYTESGRALDEALFEAGASVVVAKSAERGSIVEALRGADRLDLR
jgi:DNA-binding NarL/FixJ family response regulator